jgi:hypothetical protein
MIDHDQVRAFSCFHDVMDGFAVWDALNAMCQHLPAHLYLPAKLHPGDVSLCPYISSRLICKSGLDDPRNEKSFCSNIESGGCNILRDLQRRYIMSGVLGEEFATGWGTM